MNFSHIHFLSFMLAGCCGFLTIAGVRAAAAADNVGETVLFRKPLDHGCELAVVRGPDRLRDEVVDVVPPDGHRSWFDIKAIFPLRVDFHSPNAASLTLAARIVWASEQEGGYDVLDVVKGDRQIVVAAAENGDIILWQISLVSLKDSHITPLRQDDWTDVAAFQRIDHTMVKAKVGLTKDQLVQVEVDDLRTNFKQTHPIHPSEE